MAVKTDKENKNAKFNPNLRNNEKSPYDAREEQEGLVGSLQGDKHFAKSKSRKRKRNLSPHSALTDTCTRSIEERLQYDTNLLRASVSALGMLDGGSRADFALRLVEFYSAPDISRLMPVRDPPEMRLTCDYS